MCKQQQQQQQQQLPEPRKEAWRMQPPRFRAVTAILPTSTPTLTPAAAAATTMPTSSMTTTTTTPTNTTTTSSGSIIDFDIITGTFTNTSNNTNTDDDIPSRTPQAVDIAISNSKCPKTPIDNSNADTTTKSNYPCVDLGGSNSKFLVPLSFSLASHIVYLYLILPAWLLPSRES